jgi:hypothetical protein
MPHNGGSVEIIHAGATQRPVGRRKTGGLDDVRLNPEARSQAQNGPGVLRDIRLEKRKPDGHSRHPERAASGHA